MAKYEVKKIFFDKEKVKQHQVGDVIEITKKRVLEIEEKLGKSYIKEVKESKEEKDHKVDKQVKDSK